MSDSKKIILEESGKAFGQRMEHLVAMALEPSKLLRSQPRNRSSVRREPVLYFTFFRAPTRIALHVLHSGKTKLTFRMGECPRVHPEAQTKPFPPLENLSTA